MLNCHVFTELDIYFFGPEGKLSGEEEIVKNSNNVLSERCSEGTHGLR